MNTYFVLFREWVEEAGYLPMMPFSCQADDFGHAEEQCLNAYPNSAIESITKDDEV